jgi:hypothetical protein
MANTLARGAKWLANRVFSLEGESAPEVMLIAKLLAFCWLITGHALYVPHIFLPFWRALDGLPFPGVIWVALLSLGLLGVAGVLFSYRLRASCLLLAAVIFASTLSSRIYFSNNRLFCACLFLLLGLTPKKQRPLLVRYQVILLYLGAFIDKLLDPDWRSGQFMESFVRRLGDFGTLWSPNWKIGAPNLIVDLYLQLANLLPPMMLSLFVSWLTILTELTLAILFWRPATRPGIGLGILFHSSLLLLTGSTMGMFFYAVLFSYLAFIEWPHQIQVEAPPALRWLYTLLRYEPILGQRLLLRLQDKEFSGSAAFIRLFWCSPVFYFLLVLLLAGPWFRSWMVFLLFLLLPIASANNRRAAQTES